MGVGQQRDPFGGGAEGDALAGQAGADPERDAQVGLAGAGRAQEDDVLAAGEEVELAEVQHRLAAELVWKAKSNSSSVLRAGKRAAVMRASAAVAVAAVGLGLQSAAAKCS